MSAGPVVKCVIAILLLASVWSWVVILETLFRLFRFRRQVAQLRSGATSSTLHNDLLKGIPPSSALNAGEILRGHAQEIIVKSQGRLSDLAMITSIAPFVGLFGTVWGIMTSFAAIGSANDTSLATVAPGIAEALATTAYGLAAAIPAAVGQNRLASGFVRTGVSLRAALPSLAAELQQPETSK